MVMFRFLVALVNFVVKCHKIALGEGAGKSVSGFEIRYTRIDLQPLAVHLLFIADSDQDDLSAHRGLFNYTLSPRAHQ